MISSSLGATQGVIPASSTALQTAGGSEELAAKIAQISTILAHQSQILRVSLDSRQPNAGSLPVDHSSKENLTVHHNEPPSVEPPSVFRLSEALKKLSNQIEKCASGQSNTF